MNLDQKMKTEETSLTHNQKLLWLGQKLNPESPMYNMVMAYEINDAISFPHFKEAFQKLVEHCDVLRSRFKEDDGQVAQEFLPELDYDMAYVDFSNKENPRALYNDWAQDRAKIPLNSNNEVFDTALVKLSGSLFVWYINQYHLISDGVSTSIIFDMMSSYYTLAMEGKLNEAEALPSFKDYANNYNSTLQNKSNQAQLQHWEEKQKQFPDTPSLYHVKDVLLTPSSNRVNEQLGPERSNKLRELANKKGVRGWTIDLTFYNIFLTAIYAYIYRISGQEKLVIGSPINNRSSKIIKETVGLFIETFPLMVEIEEEETFMTLLKKVQIESNSFIKYGSNTPSTPALNRRFNVFFNYINTSNSDFNGAKVTTHWIHPGEHDPRHHLRIHVHDFDGTGNIQLYFDFNTNAFDAERQTLVPSHFMTFLDAFIEDGDTFIDEVDMISNAELSKIKNWNTTQVAYPAGETLLSKFKVNAAKFPHETALVFKESSMSYGDLDQLSNQVAGYLNQRGVKPNDIIGVSMERSIEMMVYIYGILKSGAAYLPLDTLTPVERLKFIAEDAQMKLLFYNHNSIDTSSLDKVDCLHVEHLKSEVFSQQSEAIEVVNAPEDLAYVIYTSGSTGQPKGVKCHHKGICNRLNWMNDYYPISQTDTLLQKTPITFDVSLWELFWPLQQGAKLVIEVPEGHKDPEKLIETIVDHKVSIVHFVPSMLNVFMQTKGVASCTSLNKIICSGEALSVPIVEQVFEKLDAEVHNLYGPTEASVDVTAWECTNENIQDGIPIGKPVANTSLYVLDKGQNVLPIGLIGELYIGGRQVAHGYLNRETLTNEKFITDMFSDEPNARLYRTGDLARYRADGTIEYHGRVDNQVKLRGLRIELGEIEKNLEKLGQISQAVVVIDQNENLAAYYTGRILDTNEISVFLEKRLPEYMIPKSFTYVEAFELLTSGKVNRKKLPKPVDAVQTIAKREPEGEIEEIIHSIWMEVLNIESIGTNENFMRIGGNSLNAISITSRLKDTLELDLSITDVFNYPTIKGYADNIEAILIELLNE